jgi:hypothetical protein
LFGRNFDLARKHALGKCASGVILQDLSGAAELVDETGHAGIRGPNHWPTRFYAAKNGIRQMLMRSSGPLKPSIICHVYEQIRPRACLSWKDKLSGQLADRVFETDQRGHMNIAIG